MNLRATASAFVKEGGIGLAVLVLLVLLVWLGGDYLGMQSIIAQAIIAGLVAIGILLFVTRRILAKRQAKKLANKFLELAAEDADATLGERKAKQQEIAAQLREGVAHLRMSAHGEKAVSELPWYLVVGSAGAALRYERCEGVMEPVDAFGDASRARKRQKRGRANSGVEKAPGDGGERWINRGEKFLAVEILCAGAEHRCQDNVKRHARHGGRDIDDRILRQVSPFLCERMCALDEGGD